MQVSVEPVSKIQTKLTITVPAKDIDEKVEQKLKSIAPNVKVSGFRPGKVPMGVVKQQYGSAVRQDIIGEVIQDKFYAAIVDNKIQAVGMPKIDLDSNEDGKDLVFTATVEVFPTVELKGLDKIKIEKVTAEVQDKDVDEMFETLRKQHAEWKPVKRAAKKEDQVIIDFEGYIDGNKFEGGSANDMPLVLGSNTMIPGFEDGLMELKEGDKKDIEVAFPEEYHAEDLAGKPATFKTTVKEVNEPVLSDLNDEFATKFNVDTMEQLRAEVRKNMERELEFALTTKVKEAVTEALLEQNEIEVPEALVKQEVEHLKMQAYQRMGMNPAELKDKSKLPELPAELFEEQAKKRVTLGVLMNRAMDMYEVKPDEKRVRARVEKVAQAYENPEEVIKHYYDNKQQLAEMEQAVLEDMIVEALLDAVTVKEKTVGFYDLMREAGQNPSNFIA